MEESSATVTTERRVRPSVESYLPTMSRRISWPGIFAGALTVFCVQLVLGVLGVGIGASAIDPLTERNPLMGLGVGAGLWLFIGGLLALYAGGWVSARLAGVPRRVESSLHGFLTFALTLMVSAAALTAAAGGILSGAAGIAERGLSAAQAAAGQAGGENTGGGVAGNVVDQARTAVQDAANVSPAEQRRIRETSDRAAEGVAKTGLGTALALILGALAAIFGGMKGQPRDLRLRYDTAA